MSSVVTKLIGTSLFKETQGGTVSYYLARYVVLLFQQSQNRAWDKDLMIALLITQRAFDPALVTDEMLEHPENWSTVEQTSYRDSPAYTIRYQPKASPAPLFERLEDSGIRANAAPTSPQRLPRLAPLANHPVILALCEHGVLLLVLTYLFLGMVAAGVVAVFGGLQAAGIAFAVVAVFLPLVTLLYSVAWRVNPGMRWLPVLATGGTALLAMLISDLLLRFVVQNIYTGQKSLPYVLLSKEGGSPKSADDTAEKRLAYTARLLVVVAAVVAVIGVRGYMSGRNEASSGQVVPASRVLVVASQTPSTTLRVIEGHGKDRVTGVAFSPDGKVLASSSWDKTVKLWNVETGELRITLPKGATAYAGVAFSQDGTMLASTGMPPTFDGPAWWDVDTGKLLHVYHSPKATLTPYLGLWFYAMAITPDGKTLAAATDDGSVFVWQDFDPQPVRILSGQHNPEPRLAFAPDGKVLASAAESGDAIQLREVSTGKELRTLSIGTGESGWVASIAYSLDGRRLAAARSGGDVFLWDAISGRALLRIAFNKPANSIGDQDGASSVAFSPDGKTLAVGTRGGQAILWDASSGRQVGTLKARIFTSALHSLAFSADGTLLAAGGAYGTISLWDVPRSP